MQQSIEDEVRALARAACDHVCHTRGLNPWVEACPVCGCPNQHYRPRRRGFVPQPAPEPEQVTLARRARSMQAGRDAQTAKLARRAARHRRSQEGK